MTTTVYLLWHQYEDDEEGKLLGVYSTMARAEARRESAKSVKGFRRYPDNFIVDGYEVDKDEWVEGFVTETSVGEVDDPDPSD